LEEHVASIFRVEEKANQETSVMQVASRALLAACFKLVGLFFEPEDGGDMFLRNVD
jgi:hypothetical protein